MSDERPNFTLARCCKTCHYFKAARDDDFKGVCILPQVADPSAEAKKTYTALTCDGHTWKATKRIILRWALEVGAHIPDEIL